MKINRPSPYLDLTTERRNWKPNRHRSLYILIVHTLLLAVCIYLTNLFG